MEFANKEYLLLFLLLIPYIVWYFLYRKKTEPTMRMSDTYAEELENPYDSPAHASACDSSFDDHSGAGTTSNPHFMGQQNG